MVHWPGRGGREGGVPPQYNNRGYGSARVGCNFQNISKYRSVAGEIYVPAWKVLLSDYIVEVKKGEN